MSRPNYASGNKIAHRDQEELLKYGLSYLRPVNVVCIGSQNVAIGRLLVPKSSGVLNWQSPVG